MTDSCTVLCVDVRRYRQSCREKSVFEERRTCSKREERVRREKNVFVERRVFSKREERVRREKNVFEERGACSKRGDMSVFEERRACSKRGERRTCSKREERVRTHCSTYKTAHTDARQHLYVQLSVFLKMDPRLETCRRYQKLEIKISI